MTETRSEKLLKKLAGEDVEIDFEPTCTFEEIMMCLINGEEWQGTPKTRMEELLLQLKIGGGGGYEETLLWTNPTPNVAWDEHAFEDVKRSDLEQFDAIKLYYLANTSTNVEDAIVMTYENTSTIGFYFTNRNGYTRSFLGVALSTRIGNAINQSAKKDNTQTIPYKIIGLKKTS